MGPRVTAEYFTTPPPSDAVTPIVADALDRAPCTTEVEIVVTGDFNRSVRERTPYAAYNSRHRGADETAGKTLRLADGQIVILLNGSLIDYEAQQFVWGRTRGAASRILAHEMMHAVVRARGEDRIDLDSLARSTEDRGTLGRADLLVSEYRAERALCASGWHQDIDYTDIALSSFEDFAAPPSHMFANGRFVGANERLAQFLKFLNALPYSAAMPSQLSVDLDRAWRMWAGTDGAALLAALRTVPDACRELDPAAEAAAIRQVADALVTFASRRGF